MLAGIRPYYYYSRIEPGRNEHPSPQVLDALARALRLDTAATAHLHQFAHQRGRPHPAGTERLAEGIVTLIDQLALPAFVARRYLDVLASNPRAYALSTNFVVGRNLLRQLFLDAAERDVHADWDAATAGVVGGSRQIAGGEPGDPHLSAIVDDLCVRSERFGVMWARDARVEETDAELAEDCALGAIDFAQAAMDEAESAVPSAMYSRACAIVLSLSSR
jgi:hypothetical protein